MDKNSKRDEKNNEFIRIQLYHRYKLLLHPFFPSNCPSYQVQGSSRILNPNTAFIISRRIRFRSQDKDGKEVWKNFLRGGSTDLITRDDSWPTSRIIRAISVTLQSPRAKKIYRPRKISSVMSCPLESHHFKPPISPAKFDRQR